jgi:hypothetical protein
MTGTEHDKEAEALLSAAMRDPRDVSLQRSGRRRYIPPGADERERMITLAQVHATLALAAATALGAVEQWESVAK